MAKDPGRLRLDPWAADYDASIQLQDDETPARVDVAVESPIWRGVRPAEAPPARRLAFVDGVRRVEHRVLLEEDGRTVYGVLGSYGVGAGVVDDGVARVAHEGIERVLVTGGGVLLPPFDAEVGGVALLFRPESEADDSPGAPLEGLQKAMRRSEAGLAERLAAEGHVVFLDGPLTYVTGTAQGPVVGFVKRLLRTYLEPAASALLPRLEVGERTPVFRVEGQRESRYSWYLRIGSGRAIDSALAGIVRLECASSHGLEAAVAVADLSARELPRFASSRARDPRAPQNLLPIGALEARLRHLLGDPAIVRRAVEARLHEEVTA